MVTTSDLWAPIDQEENPDEKATKISMIKSS